MKNCRELLQQAMDDALFEAKGDCEEALRSLVLENVLLRMSLARIQGETGEIGGDSEKTDWQM